jgi:hypothetical protein
LAIERAVRDIVVQRTYTASDLVFDQGLWHSPHHHSDFSDTDAAVVIQKINKTIVESHSFIKKTSHVVITLGTAWVYHHIPSDGLVANCHKIPQNQFIKRILTTEEIKKSLQNTSQLLLQTNPNMQIIWTLSPVRHLKDGMQNNALSKARLLQSIHEIIDKKNTIYFPAFEILMDDLREYRFYKNDLLHPSDVGVEYIWNIIEKTYFSIEIKKIMNEIAQINKDESHKPFHPNSEKHQAFLYQLKEKKKTLQQKYGIVF